MVHPSSLLIHTTLVSDTSPYPDSHSLDSQPHRYYLRRKFNIQTGETLMVFSEHLSVVRIPVCVLLSFSAWRECLCAVLLMCLCAVCLRVACTEDHLEPWYQVRDVFFYHKRLFTASADGTAK